jgi:hypothetical protein
MTTIVWASQSHHQVIIKKLLKVKNVICNIIRAYLMGSHAVYKAKKFEYGLSLKIGIKTYYRWPVYYIE